VKLTEIWNMNEATLIKRAGFKPSSEYNIGASLRNAFSEYHPKKGDGALDSYAKSILNSEAPDEIKKQSVILLDSIREKADNFRILLKDFNFDDNSDLATTIFTIVNGDTDPEEEDTLRFYDFNIDNSIISGMWDNVVGLLDQLDVFFDMIIGIIADPTLSNQPEPKSVGFSFQERKITTSKSKEINESIIPSYWRRFQKLANIV